jgi:peptidoglycan/LPS O-acetylase OafA/YrhL
VTWLRMMLYVVGWGLIVAAGWLKGGDDAAPGVQLGLLVGGAIIVVVLVATRSRGDASG